MAWTTSKERKRDGVQMFYVRWREGGGRAGKPDVEAFSEFGSRRNKADAEAFKALLVANGDRLPEGYVRTRDRRAMPSIEPAPASSPMFDVVGREYVAQLLDISPGQRKRYNSQVRALFALIAADERGAPYQPFHKPADQIGRADIVRWRLSSTHALKTQKNYHGLISGIFTYAMKCGYARAMPTVKTAPSNAKIKAQQGEKRYLTEMEFDQVRDITRRCNTEELVMTFAGTGARFGEVTALWAQDIDLDKRVITVNKAWKDEGEDGEQDVPKWLEKVLRTKHTMRGHYLGEPKSAAAIRKIRIDKELAEALAPMLAGKAADDFVFTSPTGLPIHNGDYTESVWQPMIGECVAAGIGAFTKHDLRHSHVGWLMAQGVRLEAIQRRLGHADYHITVNTYGHLLDQHDEHIEDAMEAVFSGRRIRSQRHLSLVESAQEASARAATAT